MGTASYSTKRPPKNGDKVDSLFHVFDALRGSHSPVSAIVCLAALIYLRWVDFQDVEAEAMAAFDESEYTPLLPASLHWRGWCDLLPDERQRVFAEKLPSAIARLQNSHDPTAAALHRLLPAILSLAQLDANALDRLTRWLAAQPFETPGDRMRLLEDFDRFLDKAAGRESAEFRTPPEICALLAALASPVHESRIYDPCFGFGGILTAAIDSVVGDKEEGGRIRRGIAGPVEVVGVEINPDAFVIGLARLALSGVANPKLEIGNSLELEATANPRKDGCDYVICNPPWGLKVDPAGLDHFPVKTNDGTGLFLQHALMQLRPGGRAVVVVPQGVLYQGGASVKVRQWLVEQHQVEAVISLPAGIFMSSAVIQAAILVLRRDDGPTKRIRMVDAAGLLNGTATGNAPAEVSPARIVELVDLAHARTSGDSAWDIDAGLLPDLDYNLAPVRREEAGLDKALAELGGLAPILPLGKVCHVSAGRNVPTSELVDSPPGDAPVPFVRIRDIQHGQTLQAGSWLAPRKAEETESPHRLRTGDILVAKAGTIGKAGIVRNGAVGGIAGSTLYVLRPEKGRLDPHYLLAYLQSNDCRQWLIAHSTGSTISGLRKKFIEQLPIPVPPLPIQERVAAACREHDEKPIRCLVTFLSPDKANPLTKWIERNLGLLQEAKDMDAGMALGIVRDKVFGQAAVKATLGGELLAKLPGMERWAGSMANLQGMLKDSDRIPDGPALYGVLQSAIATLRGALESLTGNSMITSRARELTTLCLSLLENAVSQMRRQHEIKVQVITESLIRGVENEVTIRLFNNGPLPMKSITIRTIGDAITEAVFLPERSEKDVALHIMAPAEGDVLPVELHVDLVGLDGAPEFLMQDFVFKLNDPDGAGKDGEIGASPYFVSEPVGPQRSEMFVGREEIIDRIKRQLASGNTVLLEGNRRAGKSSILKQLEGLDRIPGGLAVYSSMQGSEGDEKVAGMPSDAVWRTLARSIASGLTSLGCDLPLPDGSVLPAGKGVGIARACRSGISKDAPWEDFLEYAGVVVDLLATRNLRLVLMVDEFDKLQEGIDNGITSPQIPENIRYLIQNLDGFSAILTGSRRMQRLRNEYWSALYGLGTRIGVTALEQEAAKRLVRMPVKGRLTYTDEAVRQVLELTARQPFLIQSLCNLVFERAAAHSIRSITAPMVKEAAARFVEDNEHFASLMDYADTERKRFLVMLIHQAGKDPEPVTFGNIQQRLLQAGIELADDDLTRDLRFLRDLELVDFIGNEGGRYALAVPLMGDWLDFQIDYHALMAKARAEQENTV